MTKQEIEEACQQFVGFLHGKQGFSLLGLVNSMGLKQEEWKVIRKNKEICFGIDDIKEIDEYFNQGVQE